MTNVKTIFTEPHSVLVQRIQEQYPDYDIEPVWDQMSPLHVAKNENEKEEE